MIRGVLAVFLMVASGLVSGGSVETRDFFRIPEFTEVELSPSGEYLAITVPQEDRTELAILRVADRKVMSKWDYGPRMHPYEVQWVANDRFMVKVAEKTNWFDGFVATEYRVFFANADASRRMAVEHGATYRVIDTLPEDQRHILVQRTIERPHLFRMEVGRGRLSRVAVSPMETGGFAVDADGQVRYAIGMDRNGRRLEIHRRVEDGWEKTAELDRFDGNFDRPVGFAPDGVSVYMVGGAEEGASRLYLLNPETGEQSDLFVHDQVQIDRLVFASDRRTLIGVQVEPGRPEVHYLDSEHPEVRFRAGLEQAFAGQFVHVQGQTLDGRLMLARVYSDTNPGSVYLVDTQDGRATYLLGNRDWIKPEQMASMRPFSIAARDGTPLHGYLTLPLGREDEQDLPMVVVPHGGPHGVRDRWQFHREIQFLANRGYAVLQLNFRGSGGYGSAFQSAGYRRWGTAMQDDVADAVAWAVGQGIAASDRVCIFGASYGGYTALMNPIRHPELYRCAIGYVGVYSLPMMFTRGDIPSTTSGRNYLNRVLPRNEDERQAQSPAYRVSELDVPVMLIHGTRDERVPQAQMEFLIRQMEAVGKAPEDVFVERRSAHGIFNTDTNVEVYDRIAAFLDRHIGNGRPAGAAAVSTSSE